MMMNEIKKLSESTDRNVTITKIISAKSINEENKISSNLFRIAVNADHRDVLLNPETWPTGAEISDYFFCRS